MPVKYNTLAQLRKIAELRKKHPWVGERPLHIPQGWLGMLDTACGEIEDICAPVKASEAVEYFFATVRESKMRLFLQINPELETEARGQAIRSLVSELQTSSQHVCSICGKEVIGNGSLYNQNKGLLPDCGAHSASHYSGLEGSQKKPASKSSADHIAEDVPTAMLEDDLSGEELPERIPVEEESIASLRLYDVEAIRKLGAEVATRYRDKDDASKIKAVLNKLIKQGGDRALKPMPDETTNFLDQLQAEFPNFIQVVDMLRGVHALSDKNEVQRIPAMLLLGPPGVGKTMFAEALAKGMQTSFKVLRMENQQAGAGLVGSADFWSNSKPGAVFNVLTENDCANPVIVVDEVDKAGRDNQYNPINGLYSLLEPNSAKAFHDESLPDISIDASMVTWILTANYDQLIPEPIMSRVRVFDIPSPDYEQSAKVAQSIYQSLLNGSSSIQKKFDSGLTSEVIRLLAVLPPRKMRLAIEAALGRAAVAGRRFLIPKDIDVAEKAVEKKIGFV